MNANDNTIHIALSINDPYAQHLSVTLASLLTNYNSAERLSFHVISKGLLEENKQKITSLKSLRDFDIEFVEVNADDFKDCPNNAAYITIEAYFRIKLPSMFPHLDKILYLDVDTVVTGDIGTIWHTPMSDDDWVAGVQDIGVNADFLEKLGMKRDAYYINSGVLLMNLTALRKIGFEEKCFDYIRKNAPLLMHVDQDVINPVCEGHILKLQPYCNLLHGYLETPTPKKFPVLQYSSDEIRHACKNPVLIHYTGPTKPWFYKCKNPKAALYAHYIRLTPWGTDFKYPDKNVPAMIKKRISRLKRALKNRF